MSKTFITITIVSLTLAVFFIGRIYQLDQIDDICNQRMTTMTCVKACNQSMEQERGYLIDACRKICEENEDCKYRCLNGIPEVEADI